MINKRKTKICVVGMGPAGIGAVLTLSKLGKSIELVCLDAGNIAHNRQCSAANGEACDKEEFCQIICGFGGCSLLTGGKVSIFPAGRSFSSILGSEDKAKNEMRKAFHLLSQYLSFKKANSTTKDVENEGRLFENMGFEYRYYDTYLYDGGDLNRAYESMLSQLKSSGVSLFMGSELIKVKRKKTGFELTVREKNKEFNLPADYLVLGIGRRGRPMLRELNTKLGFNGEENFLDVGVRLQFPTALFTDKVKFHTDLKLIFGAARTFCVCKDGKVVQYFSDSTTFSEGSCDLDEKSGFTNLGITVRLPPSKDNRKVLDDVRGRMSYLSNGKILYQPLPEYLGRVNKKGGSPLPEISSRFWVKGNVNSCFPSSTSKAIKEAVGYFVSHMFPRNRWKEINVFAPEVDYGGLRFPVKSDFSISPRLYLIGDCTGRFRGILQAFSSGIICAENIAGELGENV
jgi:uncharacterized FAD-dependent dehydrogenase